MKEFATKEKLEIRVASQLRWHACPPLEGNSAAESEGGQSVPFKKGSDFVKQTHQNPTLDTLKKIAKALEVSVDDLIK